MGKSSKWQWMVLCLDTFVILISSLLTWEDTSIALPSKLSLAASATIDEQILYLFGGYIDDDINKPSNKIYKYDIHHGIWLMSPVTIPNSLPIYCYQCIAIINQTLLYIVTQHTNTIYIFDTTNDSFLPSQHIPTPLTPINGSYISVTNDELGQFMYVISYEQSRSQSTPHLQRFNSYTNQWFPSRPFPFPSHGFIASIYYNNVLFVFAGQSKHCNEITNKCTISSHDRVCGYDITTHLWSCYQSTLTENKYAASVIMNKRNHKIYIIAGWTDDYFSKTVDIFDPNTQHCSVIESLPNVGGLVITTVLNGELITFGGRNLSSPSLQHMYGGFVLRNVTVTFVPSNQPSSMPTSQPSYSSTTLPTIHPTILRSNISTYTSSLSPSKVLSVSPSITPSTSPSLNTILGTHSWTQNNTTYYHPTKLSFDSLNSTHYIKFEALIPSNMLSDYNYLIWPPATISLILFVLCSVYLCIFTSKRARQIGESQWSDFITYSSLLLKIGMLLQIADITSDYIYSISLITTSNIYIDYNVSYEFHTISWLSLLCGVIGSILFIFELCLARKLYSQISVLREQLKICDKIENEEILMDPQHDIIHAIRIRKVDIDIFAILMSGFEDIPQIILVVMATSISSGWTHIGVFSLMLSVSSCAMKFLRVMVDLFGCTDDVIDGFGYEGVDDTDGWNKTGTVSIHRNRMNDDIINGRNISDATANDDETMKSHHSIGLMLDSDEEDEAMDSDDEIENDRRRKSNSKSKKRSLRISRRAKRMINKHKLVMIPEEDEEEIV